MALPRRSGVSSHSTGYADVSELDKYKLISNIGKGSFGVISKVQRVSDGKEFALKQLDYSKMTEKDRKQILAEVAILDSLKHRNIVQLIQKIKDPKNERIYIVMEFCTSGDLGTLIRKAQRSGQPLHEDKIWNIFLQITLALHHCHWPAERPSKLGAARLSQAAPTADGGAARYQVLHRDLKPENVFLSDEFVKLGDFGLSKDMGTAAFTSTYVGTPLYMPPEILAENRYDTKSDIWSLGCLVYEMCALHSPFSTAQTQAELISMVKSGKLPPLPAQYSPALKSVIKAMLTLNPIKRPSTKDLLEMDEMKLHRKLFTVQNQTSLLLNKRDELKGYEEQLRARATALDEREKALAAREASLLARENICDSKDEESKETQRRLNQAAESLRGQWERLREEKEKGKESGLGMVDVGEEARQPRASMAPPTRPLLEERNTLPLTGTSRFNKLAHTAYGDTPSKIPLAATVSSPAPLDARFTNFGIQPRAAPPLRRGNTKSLGNLAAAARADAERDAAWAATEATPAKQTMSFSARQQRTSIGSPSELSKGGVYSEDISMATASPMSIASPWMPRPRRSSVAPPSGLNLGAQLAAINGESSSTSSGVSSEASSASSSKTSLPPTMIPAPTFVYREAATPAKWAPEDPDLPSPFLRRASTAPIPSSTTTYQSSQAEMRQPLGSINPPQIQSTTATASDQAAGGIKKMPRSKSGNLNLHQRVLTNNAAAVAMARRTSGEGAAAKARVAAVGRDARMMGM
ncbi:hypothetical protein CI109_104055 [Kwoniella shandongensis]|uniref:non-specific serine/threonine protein kinase n=1 Tax=Kwoniella shandongensis TaxID=1734106 RepID=A0A5M6BYP8_9TREE|nr:uncharacterized protein CI109_004059 [Kwoniella shandongensis]KAA5527521.1 hypothetical protein CI109_004059 [Kwoniella shandongensis]